MKKVDIIESLDYLISDINDNWDAITCAEEIEFNTMALKEAIKIIESSKVVGTLNINGKEYIISE